MLKEQQPELKESENVTELHDLKGVHAGDEEPSAKPLFVYPLLAAGVSPSVLKSDFPLRNSTACLSITIWLLSAILS